MTPDTSQFCIKSMNSNVAIIICWKYQ